MTESVPLHYLLVDILHLYLNCVSFLELFVIILCVHCILSIRNETYARMEHSEWIYQHIPPHTAAYRHILHHVPTSNTHSHTYTHAQTQTQTQTHQMRTWDPIRKKKISCLSATKIFFFLFSVSVGFVCVCSAQTQTTTKRKKNEVKQQQEKK